MDIRNKSTAHRQTGLWVGLALVGGAWLLGALLTRWYSGWDFTRSGQLGDTFGSVNALFTGLACFGVFHVLKTEQSERSDDRRVNLTLQFFLTYQSKDFSESLLKARTALFGSTREVSEEDYIHIAHLLQYLGGFNQLARVGMLDQQLATQMNRSLHAWLELTEAQLKTSIDQEPESKRIVILTAIVQDLRSICSWLGPKINESK